MAPTVTRPAPHLGMHHAALFVADMAAAQRFYVDLLGFTVEWAPDPENLYLSSGLDNLALHRAKAAADGEAGSRGRSGSLDHLGIVVAEAGDVQAWENFLQREGVPIVAPTKKHRDGATSCYVRCPAGVVVQILHHPPIAPFLAAHRPT